MTPAVKSHQKQRFWQIIVPVVLISLLLLAGLVWLILTGGTQTLSLSNLSGAALVLLALPFFLITLVTLVILAGIIFGLSKLKAVIPQAGLTVLQIFEKIRWYMRKGADISVQPLLIFNQNSEKFKEAFRSLNTRLLDKGK